MNKHEKIDYVEYPASNLEATQQKVKETGGTITKEIFSFPGGRRFHFTEPSGNEFGVWSDLEAV